MDTCFFKWDEVDMENGWITRRMGKTGNTVDIPIMQALKEYLDKLPHGSDCCFPELADPVRDEGWRGSRAGGILLGRHFGECSRIAIH